jgi:hypothetical protein
MARSVAILQSNYIPWKGYFDLINSVDEFILFDDMQYTRRDWRNRNKIKTPRGAEWLTIPVESKGEYYQKIRETRISDRSWNMAHWKSIEHNYAKAPCFREFRGFFEGLYLGTTETMLSSVNFRFLEAICRLLGIQTKISWSMDYRLVEGKTERLVDLCRQVGAKEYLSGPSAMDYIEEASFVQAGIALRFMDYSGYPEYEQRFPPFDHQVSIIDLILNTGQNARRFMRSF